MHFPGFEPEHKSIQWRTAFPGLLPLLVVSEVFPHPHLRGVKPTFTVVCTPKGLVDTGTLKRLFNRRDRPSTSCTESLTLDQGWRCSLLFSGVFPIRVVCPNDWRWLQEHCEATQSKAMTHLFTFGNVVYVNVWFSVVFFFFKWVAEWRLCILHGFEQDVATLSQHVSGDKPASYHTWFNYNLPLPRC